MEMNPHFFAGAIVAVAIGGAIMLWELRRAQRRG
jgi:hypothetical protein